ncbi:hypothetical protein FRC18_002619 [Serendipita sp. 400]|nr:hypothetical protein FRC18_002619 [Serendipita sp. 400]
MAERIGYGDDQALRLASFDGGGPRVSAQLFMLCNLMHRIRGEIHPLDHDRVVLPCEYFDMMAGADFGGLVVIMLVVLRMSAEAARDAFLKICADVYKKEIQNEKERTKVLRECIENLLKEQGQPLDLPLLADDPEATCFGFTVATPTADARTTHKFLTYYSASIPPDGLTVVEAALATCAARGYFLPATVGRPPRQYSSAGLGSGNPTRELLSEAFSHFGKDRFVSAIVSFGSGHPGVLPFPSSAPAPSSWGFSPYRNQTQSNQLHFFQELLEDCEQTSQEISRQTGNLVGIYFRFSVEQGFQGRKKDFERQDEFGTIASLVDAYLGTHETGRRLDHCVTQVCSREGVTTLERLNHVGGDHEFDRELPTIDSPFIMRKQPWSRMVEELNSIAGDQTATRVIVITGTPGAGKTWLATRFSQVHYSFFSHVCFVDGQSEATIKADLMHHARSKGGMVYSQATFKDALGFFRSDRSGSCLFFYDNVDRGDLDLVKLLPIGRQGLIIVTSRDRLKGELASEPHLHIELDVMTEDEAVETISQTSRLPNSTENRVAALAVARELGCLPVALAQAGISMFRCGYSGERYLALYRTHRDRIPGEDKAYGAFDISGQRLPRHFLDFLHLMSFMHHSNFPMEAISLAAEWGFEVELFQLAPREAIYEESIDLLKSIFCRNGQWDERSQSQMVIAIRNCSLGTFAPLPDSESLFFHMHPLIHKWSMDRIPIHKRSLFKEAATRLVACAIKNLPIRIRLLSHIDSLLWYSAIAPMHVNDRAAFGKMLRKAGRLEDAQGVWVTVRDELESRYDPIHISFATLNLEMALTLEKGSPQRRIWEEGAVELYELVYGDTHMKTLHAKRSLAETCQSVGDHETAAKLLQSVLEGLEQQDAGSHLEVYRVIRIAASVAFQQEEYNDARNFGERALRGLSSILPAHDREVLRASAELARTYSQLELYADAELLQKDVLKTAKATLKESDEVTLRATMALAETHVSRKQYTEATQLLEPAIALFQEVYGEVRATETMILLVKVYMSQFPPRLSEAIELQKQVVNILIENFGEDHTLALMEMEYLVEFYEKQNRLREAEDLLRQILKSRRGQDKKTNIEACKVMRNIAKIQYNQRRYEDAMCLEVECLDAYIEEYGSNSARTANMKLSLAATFYQLENKAQAKALAEEAAAVFVEDLENCAEDYQKALAFLDQIQNPVKNQVKMVYQEFKEPIMTELDILKYKWHRSRSGDYHRDRVDDGDGIVSQVEMTLIKGMSNVLGFFRK